MSRCVERGDFFALLGPSGCGKTTLLRMIAGFEHPDGRIVVDGVDVSALPPYRRPVNMMFQSYALFPHLDVAANIAFGLRQERMARRHTAARVDEMLALVQMTHYARRRPHQLSGGQRQRVALARALAKLPKLLLLDEPLAALDRKLRDETRRELIAIQERVGTTFLIVTHDQEEALGTASRVAVMNGGRLVQIGAPAEIYERPNSRFVADFVGEINLFEGELIAVGDCSGLRSGGERYATSVAGRDRPAARRCHGNSGATGETLVYRTLARRLCDEGDRASIGYLGVARCCKSRPDGALTATYWRARRLRFCARRRGLGELAGGGGGRH